MPLTQHDVHQILKIVDESEHLEEIELVVGELRLHIRRAADSAPSGPVSGSSCRSGAPLQAAPAEQPRPTRPAAAVTSVAAATARKPDVEVPPGTVAVRAPMLGAFYRSPAPGEKPFVEVGQRVAAGDTLCLIEVMKLFNSIKAEVAGEVAAILANDAALVEHNEVLLLIRPGA